MGTLDYNSTAESSESSYYSNTYLSSSNSNSGSTSLAIMTSSSSSNSETDNSTTYTTDVSTDSSSSSVKSTSSGKSSSTSSGISTTTLESTSSTNNSLSSGSTNTSYSTSSGNSSSLASNSSTVTTQIVTNIFSQIQTITIINASQVTTQTLPNSEVTTKTLSEQIVTLGVPIATVTSTFTGENQGTTLTTPLFLSSTTIYPNYSYEYTQFYIITADSDSNSKKKRQKIEKKHFKYNNKKKRKLDHNNDNDNNHHNFNINKRATTTTSVSTVMEVLQNVTTQPQTETITTDLAYYTSHLKDNVKAQNMVVISQFTNTQLKNHRNLGAIIGGTLGGVFGALFVSMVFLKWYIQRKSASSSSSSSKDTSIGRTKSEIDGDEVDTINPVNDGFSHYSGRRVNLFEESDLLQYYATPSPSSNNPIIRLLEICHLKSKDGGSSKMVDPFNDEFDFKRRQELQPPVIVEKSARDIVNESNPFNDSNEISFMGAEYNGSGSAHSYDSENDRNIDLNERGNSGGMNSKSDRDDENNNNNSSDDDDESVIIDTFSMSSLCPNTEIKENGMLLEII
ncbi:hypothetical protein HANVADRAFT_52677 [Hanseniaspora valbyensis NRRL Y-1626]|uniref:Mid2 domain-containing protein n=1 Tax=Hanseniaspora valbyensis NRRL Y-1626 TaxID=766949 RepID=A0A1B7TDQ8_9ASCO|nr:hypothetical protein HANVADRAFT_52677 [Hanseniaspora valbyensis NRRL Y-1626]